MNVMFAMDERLKKDACNITAFLLPSDQTVKYTFSPGAKKTGIYRKKQIKNMFGLVSKVDRSAMGNKIFCL